MRGLPQGHEVGQLASGSTKAVALCWPMVSVGCRPQKWVWTWPTGLRSHKRAVASVGQWFRCPVLAANEKTEDVQEGVPPGGMGFERFAETRTRLNGWFPFGLL